MPEKKRYSMREAGLILGVDKNTLRRWVDDSHIMPEGSAADKRTKYLSATNLTHLAQKYERTLRSLPTRSPLLQALLQRLEILEAAHTREIGELRTEIENLKKARITSYPPYREHHIPPAPRSRDELGADPAAEKHFATTYVVKDGMVSLNAIGRLAFNHGSANSEEYGRKFVAKKMPDAARVSVRQVLLWLRANRPFTSCVIDEKCECHTLDESEPQIGADTLVAALAEE